MFLGVLLVAGSRRFWRISPSCHCVCVCVEVEAGGSGLFELRVNAVKMAELAYLHPGSATEGLQAAFYVTRLTASSGGGFEGSPSLAGLGPRLTQL